MIFTFRIIACYFGSTVVYSVQIIFVGGESPRGESNYRTYKAYRAYMAYNGFRALQTHLKLYFDMVTIRVRYSIMNVYAALAAVMLIICGGVLADDYVDYPLWSQQSGYTHQSWDFGDTGEYGTGDMVSDMAALPLGGLPDGEPNYINQFGLPSLYLFTNSHPFMKGWMYSPMLAQTARKALYGGMGDTAVSFSVPGSQACDGIRLLWVQAVVYARKDGHTPCSVVVARDAAFTDTDAITLIESEVVLLEEPEGYSAAWYRVTQVYEAAGCGQAEYVRVNAFYDPAPTDPSRLGASMIDRVDIDTGYVSAADLNRSGVVDWADFAILAYQWFSSNGQSDFDGNGIVGVEDVGYFATKWLAGM